MKKNVSLPSALLFLAMLLSSCDKCGTPAVTPLEPGDEAWLPYELGSTFRFVNETDTVVPYTCTSAATTYVPAEGYSVNDKCIDKQNAEASRIIQDTKDQYPPMGMFILRSPSSFTVQVAVESHGSWRLEAHNYTYPVLQVNGTTYNNVFEVEPDSTKPSDLKRLLYNKEAGFISIEYYDGRLLQLQ